jgi:RNAse (barnase) inhibitor barstar
MEKLDSFLKDVEHCGVYTVEKTIELEHAAARNNFAFFKIDFAAIKNKEQLLNEMAKQLMFPDYFGHNWDALDDCLTDFSWLPAPGYVMVLDRCEPFMQSNEEDFDTLIEICEEAADFWAEENKPFWIVLSGLKQNTRFEKIAGL